MDPKVIALTDAQKKDIAALKSAVDSATPAFVAAQAPLQAAQTALKSYLNKAAGFPANSLQRVRVSADGGSLVIGM